MKILSLLLLFVLAAIAAFAALNWTLFVAPSELSLGLSTIQAPLGLIMLGVLAFSTALFLVFAAYLQTTALLDSRRHAKELQANRELADQAEASRFTELRRFLEAELIKRAGLDSDSRRDLTARIDRLENDLRTSIEHSGNTLAAYIGELEDRLDKKIGPSA